MKVDRIESLVSWLFTGATLIGVGLFLLIRGWFFTQLGQPPLTRRGSAVDPQIALAGASLLLVIGLCIVACAVMPDSACDANCMSHATSSNQAMQRTADRPYA